MVTVLIRKMWPPPKTSFVVWMRIAEKANTEMPIFVVVWDPTRFCWQAPRKNSAQKAPKMTLLGTQHTRKRARLLGLETRLRAKNVCPRNATFSRVFMQRGHIINL